MKKTKPPASQEPDPPDVHVPVTGETILVTPEEGAPFVPVVTIPTKTVTVEAPQTERPLKPVPRLSRIAQRAVDKARDRMRGQ